MSATVANNFFKELPFPVHPSQRLQLQHYKASAVAKEKVISARRNESLLLLQKYVAERIEGKRERQRPAPAKGPAESVKTGPTRDEPRSSNYPSVTTAHGSSSREHSVKGGQHTLSELVRCGQPAIRVESVRSSHPPISNVDLVRSGHTATSRVESVRSGHPATLSDTPQLQPPLNTSRTPSLTSRAKSEWKVGKGLRAGGVDGGRRGTRAVHPPAAKSRTPASVLGAIARGYLTRRLFNSPKVQSMIRTIKDLLDVLATLQEPLSVPDQQLKISTMAQLSVARHSLHDVFFNLIPSEQLRYSSTRDHLTTSRLHTHDRTPGLGQGRTKFPANHSTIIMSTQIAGIPAPPSSVASPTQSAAICAMQAVHPSMLQNPPMLSEHSSAHSRLPGMGLTSSSAGRSVAPANSTATSHGNRSGGVGGKLSAATIKCMQRRRARNT